MARNLTSLEQKQECMRERHCPAAPAAPAAATAAPVQPGAAAFIERHFTVAEIAGMWNLSTDTVRRLFEREPGVMVLGDPNGGPGKRRYTILRIPESVARRVHRRLVNFGT